MPSTSSTSRMERSWILYDCGNSAYSMAVVTALFPVYFGMLQGDAMALGYYNAMAGLIVAFLSPVLGTIADYEHHKLRFFVAFWAVGIFATLILALIPSTSWQWLAACFVISGVGFAGANIFYDAFLVDVTRPERYDIVSSRGFALGYIASVLPFGISLVVVLLCGISSFAGYRFSFLLTGLWWGMLTVPLLRNVRQLYFVPADPQPVRAGFRRLANTFRNIRSHRNAFYFLLSYFFYIDGVDTIIKMVVPYATALLGAHQLDTIVLLAVLLLIQVVAFPCALLFGRLAERFGALPMIRVGIITYVLVILMAMQLRSLWQLFVLGGMVAFAQGGIQALSRSYFATLIPKEQSNEFFGFYNIFGKFAAIMGPAIMAFLSDWSGNVRISILGLMPLFVIGFVLTFTQTKNTSITAASQTPRP